MDMSAWTLAAVGVRWSSTAIFMCRNWTDQCHCRWWLHLFSWNHLCNLAALHGSVSWHLHCRCKVFGRFWRCYLLMGWCTPGFCKTLILTHRNPYPYVWVWVFTGTSMGSPGIPQGYLWQSLTLQRRAMIYDERWGECVFSPTSISTCILLLFDVAPEPTTSASHVSRGLETSDIAWLCPWGVVT